MSGAIISCLRGGATALNLWGEGHVAALRQARRGNALAAFIKVSEKTPPIHVGDESAATHNALRGEGGGGVSELLGAASDSETPK